jgi:aspartokinase-like uncharacterized kinase
MMKGPHQPLCDVLIKVGGSILDNIPDTLALAEALVARSTGPRIVVLPGGGRVAKRIKSNQREREADFLCCWRATTLALDVNAGVLASHSPRFAVCISIGQIKDAQDGGFIPIFAPAQALFSSLWFTPNWIATTDTMGLYFAHVMGAARYVVVTDVDGVCEKAPGSDSHVVPLPRIRVSDLERLPSSKLDAAFPAFFRKYPVDTVVINGKHPSRVSAAILGRRTFGTEIVHDSDHGGLNGSRSSQLRVDGSKRPDLTVFPELQEIEREQQPRSLDSLMR